MNRQTIKLQSGYLAIWPAAICIIIIMTSCSSSPETIYSREENQDGKPNWVADGTQTLSSSKGRAFIAVGSASTRGADFAIQATKANLLCKKDMGEMLSRFVSVTARDYLASGAAEVGGISAQNIEKNISQITETVMSNVFVNEHWVDNREKFVYAISEITYSRLTEIIISEENINAGFKAFLNKNGAAIFDRIATDHDFANQQPGL